MKSDLKNTFTTYWEYMALQTACKKNIFDLIFAGKNTIKKLLVSENFNEAVLTDLIDALEQAKTLTVVKNKIILTTKGELLTEQHKDTLKYACIHWAEETMTAWQNLNYTLTTGKQAFKHIFKKPFFDYLAEDKNKLEGYHKAMNEYARDDYKNICEKHDFNIHNSIIDVGGSLGALIKIIAKNNVNLKCYLFELPEVATLIKNNNYKIINGNFFDNIPQVAEALIMSRIIHNWNNLKALQILKNVYKSLPKNGTLYIIENLTDKIEDKASLLSLNMHLITDSYERSLLEYNILLEKTNFKYIEYKKINELQYLIIYKKI